MQECKIFLDWLYEDATIYLNRKYNRYIKWSNKMKLSERIFERTRRESRAIPEASRIYLNFIQNL